MSNGFTDFTNVDVANEIHVSGTKVVGTQQTGGTAVDAAAFDTDVATTINAVITTVNELTAAMNTTITALDAHGLTS